MSVTVQDMSGKAIARYDAAAQRGLDAAAAHLTFAVQKAHGSSYYNGGAFRSTLYVRQSIRRLTPYRGVAGKWETQVGTNKIQALYWELGHHNLFTRKHERFRVWEPTGLREQGRMAQIFASTVARAMGVA